MAGLVPVIHVFLRARKNGVDARDKPGHGDFRSGSAISKAAELF
jgi:hypothetical protein